MLSFTVLFALIFVSPAYTLIQTAQSAAISDIASLISSENCNFYSLLNAQLECGPKSHLIQYSYKYCQRLLDARVSFDNTQYQDNVRQCLQQKLYAKIQQVSGQTITCDSLKSIDLESHGSCLAVSFKQLSMKDVKQFMAIFKDTTVNYPQLCKLANSVAGHWSQAAKGDLMLFIKQQLKEIFPEGDTTKCTIKERDFIDEIIEIIEEVGTILDKVKKVKEDVSLIIEKSKAVRDEFKTIQQTIEGMKDGSITTEDGLKEILAKSKAIAANSKTIIETIKNLGKDVTNTGAGQTQSEKLTKEDSLILEQIAKLIEQFNALKGEVYNIIDNVNSIVDIVGEIRDGKKTVADGVFGIIGQLEQGVDNIYSIIDTSYALKETVLEIVESLDEAVGEVVDGLVDKVDETVGGVAGGVTDAIGGGLGGIGK